MLDFKSVSLFTLLYGLLCISILVSFLVARFGYRKYENYYEKQEIDKRIEEFISASDQVILKLEEGSIDREDLVEVIKLLTIVEESIEKIEMYEYRYDKCSFNWFGESVHTLKDQLWGVVYSIESKTYQKDVQNNVNNELEKFNDDHLRFSRCFQRTFWSLKDNTF